MKMDERCKEEMKASFIKCQEEGTSVTNLINDILQKHKLLLDTVNSYNPQEVVQNRSIIVDSTQLNYLLFNKLFAINIELDSFWRKCQEQSPQNIIDLYNSDHEIKNEIQAVESKQDDKGSYNIDDALSIPSRESFSSSSEDQTELAETMILTNKSECESHKNGAKITQLNPSVDIFRPSEELINSIKQGSFSSSSSDLALDIVDNKTEEINFQPEKEITETSKVETVLPSEGENIVQTKNKTVKENQQSSMREAKGTSIEEALANHNLRDRFEREHDKIKTFIPELPFVSADDSASDYYSAPDRDSSYKSLKQEPQKIQAQDRLKRLKKDPKENFEEIPEHKGPNLDDKYIVVYLKNPSEFYITPVGDQLASVLGVQLEEISKANKPMYKTKLDAKLAIGKYSIAYSKSFGTWNRAEVINWKMTHESLVDIQYVDYGEYESVPYIFLMPIPQSICKIPRQVIRCRLPFLFPNNDRKQWTSEAIEHFTTLCYNDNAFADIKIDTIAEKSNGFHEVDFHKISGNGKTATESMFTSGHAKIPADCSDQCSEYEENASRNFMIEQIKNAQGSADSPDRYETLAEAMLGYDAQDDLRLCRFATIDGTCYKGARCKLEHRRRRKHGITSVTQVVLMVPNDPYKPDVDDELTVNITYFKNPSEFYGQVKHGGNRNGDVMKEMFKLMNKRQMVNSYESFVYPPAVGEYVIVKNSDERWYRALVFNVNESVNPPLVTSFFVDFGEVVDAPLGDVRKMKPGFSANPYQACRFGISNVQKLPEYDPEAFMTFVKPYLFTNVWVKVKYAGDEYIDGVVRTLSGEDIGLTIINNNFGTENTLDLYPLGSSNILVD